MSMGFGGSARIVLQDEKEVVNEYSPYNLNELAYENREHIYDGSITICKDALVGPDIHERMKRMPGGRKRIIMKKVYRDVDYTTLFSTGKIVVENSRFCWQITDCDCGMIALRLIFAIFDRYQEEGMLPKQVSYCV